MKDKQLERTKKRLKRVFDWVTFFRSQRLDYPFVNFVGLMPFMTDDTIKSLAFVPCPRKFCKKPVSQDLQGVTFGVLTRLQTCAKNGDYFKTCCNLVEVLTDVPAEKVARARAVDVIGVVNMVQAEMTRIGKLFQSLNVEHTSEEIRAGIDRLEFGTFGLIDWYAKRMGIIDHEEVFKTPWQRVFQCMRIDHENNEFEKRYRNIITRGIKKK